MPRKELKIYLTNEEIKELYLLMDSLSGPIYEKLKKTLASTIVEQYRGSFLWHVMLKYKCDKEVAKRELEKQYNEKGTEWMASHWGFSSCAVRRGLQKLGIGLKPRVYNNAPFGLASEAFEKYGGIEKVLKKFHGTIRFSLVCGVHHTTLGKYLRKNGWYYDKNERKWKKRQNKGGKNGH